MTAQYRLLRFTADSCGICKAQKKALVVERFKDAHGGLQVVEYVCAENNKAPPEQIEAYKLSDKYGVKAFPTLVIEAKLDGGDSLELLRVEGGVTVKALDKNFNEAVSELVSRHVEW